MGMITVKEAVERYTMENGDWKESSDLYRGINAGLVTADKPEGTRRGIKVDYASAAEYLANPPAAKPRPGKTATTESLVAQFEKQAQVAIKQHAFAKEALDRAKFQGGRRDVNIELLHSINKQLADRDEDTLTLPAELQEPAAKLVARKAAA